MVRELGVQGIAVNAIAPRLTPTEETSGVSERERQQYQSRQLLAGTPIPRGMTL
jgi:NAD(P)-dependent dehydrogenase (short-subunit alcohol dehydrogenase family)